MKQVRFLGAQKQSEIPQLLAEQDVLVLPSIYDGWGAVVNEGLQAGLYTICSDACGAKDLLGDSRCGAVFAAGDATQLAARLQEALGHVSELRANRSYRIQWAKQAIGGSAVARYMVDCLCGLPSNRPWIKE